VDRKSKRARRLRTTTHAIVPEFYLRRAPDALESHSTLEAHFDELGFSKNLDPNPLTSVEYCRVARQNGVFLENASDFRCFCNAISINSLFSTHPLICPGWISFQLGLNEGDIDDLYNHTLSTEWFSPHPMIRPIPVARVAEEENVSDVSVHHFIRFLRRNVAEYSMLDLKLYGKSHKDLAAVSDDVYSLALHFLRDGLFQNRLKYKGISLPRNNDYGSTLSLFLAHAIDSLKDSPEIDFEVPGTNLTRLPSRKDLHYSTLLKHIEALKQSDGFAEEDADVLKSVLISAIAASSGTRGHRVVFPYTHTPRAQVSILDTDLATHSKRQRRVVYTVNIGGYDDLSDCPQMPGYEYYVVTDRPATVAAGNITVVRPTIREYDTKRACLWYKTHPHILFPDAEACVWMDANIISGPEAADLLIAHEALSEVATFHHPDRDCIYEEAKVIVDKRLDDRATVDSVLNNLRAEGFPAHNGLFETNVMYSRSNDHGVRRFFDEWWRRIVLGSRRDQLSFTPAARRCGVTISLLDGNHSAKTSRVFSKSKHVNPLGRITV
jgi:hypothetical protein